MFALAVLLSVVGLFVGPALAVWARGRALAMAALDGVTLGIIPALLVVRLLPHLVEEIGVAAVLAVAAGYAGYLLIEARDHHRAATLGIAIVLPTLVAHSFLDGAALALAFSRPVLSVGSGALAAALVLHKVPEGLFIASRVPTSAGLRGFAPVAALGATTVLGALTGRELVAHAPHVALHVFIAVGLGIMLRMVVHSHAQTEGSAPERAVSAVAFVASLVVVVAIPSRVRVFDQSQPDELSAAQALVPLFLESAPWLLLVLVASEIAHRVWPQRTARERSSTWLATTAFSVTLLGMAIAAVRALVDPLLRRLAVPRPALVLRDARLTDFVCRARFVLPSYAAGVVLAACMEAALPRASLGGAGWLAIPAAIVGAECVPIGAAGACVVGTVAVHKGVPLAAGLAFMLTQATAMPWVWSTLARRAALLVGVGLVSTLAGRALVVAGLPSLHGLGQHMHTPLEWCSAACLVGWTVLELGLRGPRTWARAVIVSVKQAEAVAPRSQKGEPMMFGNRNDEGSAAAVRTIKQQARALFDAHEDDTVVVSELRCTEPGCPPVETVIALLRRGAKPRQVKVHKPTAEVTAEDLRSAFQASEHHHH